MRNSNNTKQLPILLHIETSAEACSVCLSKEGMILAARETLVERSHAHSITVFIAETMKESQLSLQEVDAICVSKGPGSYTGLRIGVSTAKGLCYAMEKPLIALGTLDSMAECIGKMVLQEKLPFHLPNLQAIASEISAILEKHPHPNTLLLCPMMDARRQEVYAGLYDVYGNTVRQIQADIVDENTYLPYLEKGAILFFGPGATKCQMLIQHPNAIFVGGIYPSSLPMLWGGERAFQNQKFENTAYFEPYYLKDFAGSIPLKKPLGI